MFSCDIGGFEIFSLNISYRKEIMMDAIYLQSDNDSPKKKIFRPLKKKHHFAKLGHNSTELTAKKHFAWLELEQLSQESIPIQYTQFGKPSITLGCNTKVTPICSQVFYRRTISQIGDIQT